MQAELILFLCAHCNAFAAMAAIAFRAQIKAFWNKTVLFAFSFFAAIWAALLFIVVTGLERMSAAGVRGGFYLSNYASAHFVPVMCLMLILFAFMIAGFLLICYFSRRAHIDKIGLTKTDVYSRVKCVFAAIVKPRFVLLQ